MSKPNIKFNYFDTNNRDSSPVTTVEVKSTSKGPVQVNSLYQTYIDSKYQISTNKNIINKPEATTQKIGISNESNQKVAELPIESSSYLPQLNEIKTNEKTRDENKEIKIQGQISELKPIIKDEDDKKDIILGQQKKKKYTYINVPIQQQSKDQKCCYCFKHLPKKQNNVYKIQE